MSLIWLKLHVKSRRTLNLEMLFLYFISITSPDLRWWRWLVLGCGQGCVRWGGVQQHFFLLFSYLGRGLGSSAPHGGEGLPNGGVLCVLLGYQSSQITVWSAVIMFVCFPSNALPSHCLSRLIHECLVYPQVVRT